MTAIWTSRTRAAAQRAPRDITGINWESPQARALQAFWCYANGELRELTGKVGQPTSIVDVTYVPHAPSDSLVPYFNGTSAYAYLGAFGKPYGNVVEVMSQFIPRGIGGMVFMNDQGTTSGNGNVWFPYVRAYNDIEIYRGATTTTADLPGAANVDNYFSGRIVDVAEADGAQYIWNIGDGTSDSDTTAGTLQDPTTSTWLMGADADVAGPTPPPGNYFTGEIIRVAMFNVRKTDEERAAWKSHPWDLVKGGARIYSIPKAAGGDPSGTAAQTLGKLTQSASGTHTAATTGTAVQTLSAINPAGTGEELFTGTAAQTLGNVTQVASGLIGATGGTGAQTLPAVTQAGAGVQTVSGTAVQTLPILAQSADGILLPEGAAAQILPSMQQAGSGTHTEAASGTGAQTLPAIEQQANGSGGDVVEEDRAPTGGFSRTLRLKKKRDPFPTESAAEKRTRIRKAREDLGIIEPLRQVSRETPQDIDAPIERDDPDSMLQERLELVLESMQQLDEKQNALRLRKAAAALLLL